MPTRQFPRREPRVMAVVLRRHCIAFAVVDPLEIRATGEAAASRAALRLVLRRLVLREKPTALVLGRGLTGPRSVARRGRLPVVRARAQLLTNHAATELFTEFPLFATNPLVDRALRLAITSLLTQTFPSRTYAHRRPTPVRARARTLRRRRDARGPRAGAPCLP